MWTVPGIKEFRKKFEEKITEPGDSKAAVTKRLRPRKSHHQPSYHSAKKQHAFMNMDGVSVYRSACPHRKRDPEMTRGGGGSGTTAGGAEESGQSRTRETSVPGPPTLRSPQLFCTHKQRGSPSPLISLVPSKHRSPLPISPRKKRGGERGPARREARCSGVATRRPHNASQQHGPHTPEKEQEEEETDTCASPVETRRSWPNGLFNVARTTSHSARQLKRKRVPMTVKGRGETAMVCHCGKYNRMKK